MIFSVILSDTLRRHNYLPWLFLEKYCDVHGIFVKALQTQYVMGETVKKSISTWLLKNFFSAYEWNNNRKSNRTLECDPEYNPKLQIDVLLQGCNNSFPIPWVGWDVTVSSFPLSWLLNFLMTPSGARPNFILLWGADSSVNEWMDRGKGMAGTWALHAI